MTDILLITEQSIKNITNISDNMAGKLLLTAIRESQEINLREILGDALLDELKRQVAENDVRETYNHLILQCQYYLAYQSCANICMITSVKIDNAGLQRVSDEKMEPLPVSEVNQIHDYYQTKADFYCERLQHYLLQHKGDFPELNTRQCNTINANLYSSATCGIFLGGPRSKGTQRDCDGLNANNSLTKEELNVELTENGTYDYTPKGYGFNKAHIVVNTPEIRNQEKNINITENGHSEIVSDPEYTGMNKVDITVDVHPSERLVRTYTKNGVYDITGEYKDAEITVNIGGDVEKYKYLVNKADETGLAELGWDEDSINYFKYNNYVAPTDTTSYKVSAENIALKDVVVDLNSCRENINNPNLEYLPMIDTSGETSLNNAFQNSYIKGIPMLNTSNVIDFTWTFGGSSIKTIPPIDTANGINFYAMFYGCRSLSSIPELNTSKSTDFGNMFQGCASLIICPPIDTANGTNFYGMFYGCKSLSSVSPLNTSKGENFENMFSQCSNLTSIPALDTSNATNLSSLFSECVSLTSIPNLNTSKCTNFNAMFSSCSSLTTIPMLDTSNGQNFGSMFNGCLSLTSIPAIDTSNGSEFGWMFPNCSKLTNLPPLDLSNGVNFYYMFQGCNIIQSMPTFNISKGMSMIGMFDDCYELTDITFTGSINGDISFNNSTKISFDSIKSILTACANTTNTNPKTVSFSITIQDQNNELQDLITQCTEKGWTVSGLNITTE